MHGIELSINDVFQHVVSIGLDIHPPIELKNERTRLNMFYEEARESWSELYDGLQAGESDFRISRSFGARSSGSGSSLTTETFVLTPRGPVFVFPLHLPLPIGSTGFEGRFASLFKEINERLWARLPGHTVVKAGLVRDVIFQTGRTDHSELVSSQVNWSGAKLVGGVRVAHYLDDKCNVRVEFGPGRIAQITGLPLGARVQEPVGFGVRVRLDVNNVEIRRLSPTEIEEIIDRACSFWPDELLQYLSGGI